MSPNSNNDDRSSADENQLRTQIFGIGALVYALLIGLGFYYLFFGWFSVAPNLFVPLSAFSAVLAVPLTIAMYFSPGLPPYQRSKYIHSKNNRNAPLKRRALKPFLLWLRANLYHASLLYLGALMFTWVAIVFGVTGLFHQFTAEPYEDSRIVVSRSYPRERRRSRCIRLEGQGYFNGNFCRLEREMWSQINRGDWITMEGWQSPFGTSVAEFRHRG